MLALAALKANDTTSARKWFEQITSDLTAPAGLRQRIETLMALAGVDSNS